MVVNGALLQGRIKSNDGNGGSITTLGINFVPGGSSGGNARAYEGGLKTNQKGVVSINNLGNRAQIIMGGGDVDMEHKGFFTPQMLQIGASNSPTGPTCLSQALGPLIGDSGYTTQLDTGTGTLIIYVNCYLSDSAGNVAPIITTKDSHIISLGGGSFSTMDISRYKFTNTTPVSSGTFQKLFSILQGAGDSFLSQAVIVPPKMSADPTFNSGDYWEGGFYYNTSTNKMRVNIGGGSWADMN